jgi:hypothetical protein
MKEKQSRVKVYSKECSICNKEIEGYSESQVDYNMSLHHNKHKSEDNKK